jgi:hypothetical protein
MIQYTFESSSGNITARYFIAQHMPDALRRELKNIGVVVQKGDGLAARFLGERDSGDIDGRSIRTLSDPSLYRMWIRHWRKTLGRTDWESRFLNDDRKSFSFIQGGEVTETGSDSAEQVCAYLYSMLVSEGGISEALGHEIEDAPLTELRTDIVATLRGSEIMSASPAPWVRFPVYTEREVKGGRHWHQASLCQESDSEICVMEPLNLSSPQRRLVKERAGYIAHVFDDLRAGAEISGKNMNLTAIVRVTDEDRTNDAVKYALEAIEDANLVTWNNPRSQSAFVAARLRAAA